MVGGDVEVVADDVEVRDLRRARRASSRPTPPRRAPATCRCPPAPLPRPTSRSQSCAPPQLRRSPAILAHAVPTRASSGATPRARRGFQRVACRRGGSRLGLATLLALVVLAPSGRRRRRQVSRRRAGADDRRRPAAAVRRRGGEADDRRRDQLGPRLVHAGLRWSAAAASSTGARPTTWWRRTPAAGLTTLPFLFGTPAWAAGDDGQACFGGDCASYRAAHRGDAGGVRGLRRGGGAPVRAGRHLLGPAPRAPLPADRDLADLERAEPELVLPALGRPLGLRAPGGWRAPRGSAARIPTRRSFSPGSRVTGPTASA